MSHPALRVGVVGAGRVGAVLAARLRAAGHEIVAAAGDSDATLQRIATLLPGVPNAKPSAVARDCDVLLRCLSMGVTHRAVPGTAALCAAAAAAIPGTVVHHLSAGRASGLRIGTPSGVVVAAADVTVRSGHAEVVGASLFRTARPLMRGQVGIG